jgi:hypothetical protein
VAPSPSLFLNVVGTRMWLLKPLLLLLMIFTPGHSWTSFNIRPRLSESLGYWKLLQCTNQEIQNFDTSLLISPDLMHSHYDEEDARCDIKCTMKRRTLLSSGWSHYVKGELFWKEERLKLTWRARKQLEIQILGVGLGIESLDIVSDTPKGTCRQIHFEMLNINTLRIIYDADTYIFIRTVQENGSIILTPLDVFIGSQILSQVYNHYVHLNL